MKKFLECLVVVLLLSVSMVKAQEVAVATLEHNGEVSVFYGDDALIDAHAAATHGDVITLSAGSFNAVEVTKAVSIKGICCMPNSFNLYTRVIRMLINITDSVNNPSIIEGIYIKESFLMVGKMKNCTFSKCRMNDCHLDGSSENCSFISCRLGRFIPDENCQNLYIGNCIIDEIHGTYNSATLLISNSILLKGRLEEVIATYKNNIINCSNIYDSPGILSSSSVAYNNVFTDSKFIGRYGNPNACAVNVGNKYVSNTILLKNGIAGSGLGSTVPFQLTDSAAINYLGTDGTQVGIYGGDNPFSDIPSIPQITQSNIAAKTTADGKLSVNIKVEVQK